MNLRTLAAVSFAALLSGCGGGEPSKGGCLYHWNKGSNDAALQDAAEHRGEDVTLGKADGVECALQIRTRNGLLTWELHAAKDGRYRWRAGTITPTREVRRGTVKRDGTFIENDEGSKL